MMILQNCKLEDLWFTLSGKPFKKSAKHLWHLIFIILHSIVHSMARNQVILDPEQARMFKENLSNRDDSESELQPERLQPSRIIGELVVIPQKSVKCNEPETTKSRIRSDDNLKKKEQNKSKNLMKLEENVDDAKVSTKKQNLLSSCEQSKLMTAVTENYVPFVPYLVLSSFLPGISNCIIIKHYLNRKNS